MKRLNFKSIRTHLTFWFLVLSLVPLLTTIVVTYFQRAIVIETSTFDKLTAIRDLKVERVNDWLYERMGDITVISEDEGLFVLENLIHKTSFNSNDQKTLTQSRQILSRFLRNYNDYYEFFVINPDDGKILASTKEYMEGQDKSNADYFTNPLQTRKLSIKDIYFSNTLSEYTMTYSIPIFSGGKIDGDIIGILVAHININNSLFKMLLERVGLGETGETLIVNKDAVALNQLRWHENAPLNLQISAEPAVKSSQGETGIAITTDYRNESILAAYTYIPIMKWGFVCKQDMKELNAPIREMIWNFIVIFIVSAIVIVLIAIRISKSISKPIVKMNRVAEQIKGGDYSVRNTISSEDELGALASQFNNMAEITESTIKTQKSIASISETMIGRSNLQDFGISLLKRLMKITDADMSTFYILNEGSEEYEHFASVGANKEMLSSFNAKNPQGEIGNTLSTKSIFHLKNIPEDTIFKFKTIAGEAIPKEILTIPIIVENAVVAIISLVNLEKFSMECHEILKQSWINLNTSYSNLLAGERTRIFAEQLSITNQQLEAQTEELQEQSEELQNQTDELHRTTDELQEQNIELEAQRKQVEAANKMKSEFLSNMSHELRTPLNSIMALSRVLIMQANKKLSKEENSYLEIVERNGKRLLSLINDILDLSKIEAGKMDIRPENISVKSLIHMTKDNLSALADEKGLAITLNISEDMPPIETEEAKVHQILTNIVGNAVKFTNEGSIDITANYDSKNTYIEVKDSGIGISQEMLPHIFDEFRQADGTSSRQYEGTGLGLAIAKKMTQILGGSLSVESELGKGSLFTLSLPIKWHEDISLNDTINLKTSLSNTTIIESKNVTKKNSEIRILMVEDNQDAIIQVKTVLEKEKYKIDVALNGKEALEYVKHTIPDGIILDLMIPKIDGFEVLERLRSTAETKNIPVLILTAKDLSKDDLSRLSNNNIQQLIHKGDVDIEGLIQKVKLMLRAQSDKKLVSNSISSNNQLPTKRDLKHIKSLPTILVVEDNPDNMITLKAILGKKYQIKEATDGEYGLALAHSLSPDLILLDISLPKISGDEIIKLIKEDQINQHIPVIAVTAQAMKGDKEKIIKLGCDAYISKPIDGELLLKEIEKLLDS